MKCLKPLESLLTISMQEPEFVFLRLDKQDVHTLRCVHCYTWSHQNDVLCDSRVNKCLAFQLFVQKGRTMGTLATLTASI